MRDYKKESQETFDAQAKVYDETFYGKHARALYAPLCERLKTRQFTYLLDVGCGTGKLLSNIHEQHPDAYLFGIDISNEMLHIARENLGEYAIVQYGDAEFLPYASGSMNVITCNDSFHHYPNPLEVLNAMYCVLEKGGVLLIGESYAPFGIRHMMNLYFKKSKDGDVKIYTKKEMIKMLEFIGFQDITWTKTKYNTCLIEAHKS